MTSTGQTTHESILDGISRGRFEHVGVCHLRLVRMPIQVNADLRSQEACIEDLMIHLDQSGCGEGNELEFIIMVKGKDRVSGRRPLDAEAMLVEIETPVTRLPPDNAALLVLMSQAGDPDKHECKALNQSCVW